MPEGRGSSPERDIAIAFVIGLVTTLVYWRAAAVGFTADDFFILSRVKALGGLAHPLAYFGFDFFEYYRPLGFLSHALDWTMWGTSATGFHVTNVLLHVASSALVFVIGRRLLDSSSAVVAMVLFAWHPASQEAVYWMAARFDLLATCLVLVALLLFWTDRPAARVAGIVAYALALLCKESALSLLVFVAALEVFIHRRGWRDALVRLAPLVLVTLGYVALRAAATDVVIAGGERRLPKLVLMGAVLGAIVWTARAAGHADGLERLIGTRFRRPWRAIAIVTIVLALACTAALTVPATSAWMREKLGFVAYASYYLVSPVVTISPPLTWFDPGHAGDARPGLVLLVLIAAVTLFGAARVRRYDRLAFVLFAVVGALLPVLSMTGGTRYLYLAAAPVSWAAAWAFQTALATRWRSLALFVLPIVAVVSINQIMVKGRDWQWASEMTRMGVETMSRELEPCGTRRVVLLTAPAGVRGVYSNIPWEAFDVLHGCAPAELQSLLRVVGADADVVVSEGADAIEIRVRDYRGQIVASSDLSRFDQPIDPGATRRIETPLGPLDTAPDGDAQVFRLQRAPTAASVQFFYFSRGAVRRAGR